MPSIRSASHFLVSLLPAIWGLQSPVRRLSLADVTASSSCPNPQLSCHNSTAVSNLCCFNAPGGSLLQTQFWDSDPAAGPSDSWTIHGLWPDNCDGSYPQYCDTAREYSNVTAILKAFGQTSLLDYMDKYWISNEGPNGQFWNHEWDKHGTCVSTLNPDCFTDYKPGEEVPPFFERVVSLFKTLPTYEWLKDAGITPSTTATYSLSKIQAALSSKHGNNVYIGCSNGVLSEVYYYYNVRGSLQSGTFVSAAPVGATQNCPSSGIKYPPKQSSS